MQFSMGRILCCMVAIGGLISILISSEETARAISGLILAVGVVGNALVRTIESLDKD